MTSNFHYVRSTQLKEHTGLSRSFWQKKRREGRLIEGVHFKRISGNTTVYNKELLLDWLKNADSPESHQRAISRYLESLPSYEEPPVKSGLALVG